MAFTPTPFLNNSTNTVLRDQQHASRMFVNDQFRLAPKHKFLFHVAFSINEAALTSIDFTQRHRNEINMLVKSVDLPNYTIKSETLNQYNRKKNVASTHSYNPINILFHDDNMGVVNKLWQNYYNYYFADPVSASNPGAMNRNAIKNGNYINNNFGLDNGSTLAFFNYIKIYQMARHEYVCYTLHNPIITAWNHNKVDYGQTGIHDNSATVAYEAVSYTSGTMDQDAPEGFGLEHYDTTPSPLQAGSSTVSASPSFSSNNVTVNSAEFLQNLTKSVNSYQNSQTLNSSGFVGASSIIAGVVSSVSGLGNTVFPGAATSTTDVTTATLVNIKI